MKTLGVGRDASQAADIRRCRSSTGPALPESRRVPARRSTSSARDAGARRLAVLDVGGARRSGRRETGSYRAADHVGIQREEILDVAAVARQIAELLLVEPAGDRLAFERDVVLPFRGDRDDVLEPTHLQVEGGEHGGRGAEHHPGRCTFLKPLSEAVTVQVPGRRLGASNNPSASVCTSRLTLVDSSVMTTLAPGTICCC